MWGRSYRRQPSSGWKASYSLQSMRWDSLQSSRRSSVLNAVSPELAQPAGTPVAVRQTGQSVPRCAANYRDTRTADESLRQQTAA